MTTRDIQPILKEEFKKEFGKIDVSVGYDNVIFITAISKKFDSMNSDERYKYMHKIIDKAKLTEEEKLRIGGLYFYSPKELFSEKTAQ